jgi:hypothetical protein
MGAACEQTEVGFGDYISSKLAEYASGCVDGKKYYLVDPDGQPKSYDAGVWTDNEYSELNGLANNGTWSGIHIKISFRYPIKVLSPSLASYLLNYRSTTFLLRYADCNLKGISTRLL